jgi:hypothetical protein
VGGAPVHLNMAWSSTALCKRVVRRPNIARLMRFLQTWQRRLPSPPAFQPLDGTRRLAARR